ncbi:MAG: ferritin family protein [Candidatus Altiarchaeota archaeon]
MPASGDILKQAIGTEQAAYEFYRKCADATAQENLKGLFSKLASEELKHKEMLSSLNPESSEMVASSISWFNVVDTLWTSNSENTKNVRNILEFAMGRELKEGEYYRSLSEMLAEPRLKRLCASLAVVESGHYSLLRAEYERFIGSIR